MEATEKFVLDLLQLMVTKGCDQVLLLAGSPPLWVAWRKTFPVAHQKLERSHIEAILRHILECKRGGILDASNKGRLAIEVPALGRFRVEVFGNQGETGIAIWHASKAPRRYETLGLSHGFSNYLDSVKSGLVLIAGEARSGRSTTMGALINLLSQQRSGHIATIEDRLHCMHTAAQSIVTQMEIGVDTPSWQSALDTVSQMKPNAVCMDAVQSAPVMHHAITHYSRTNSGCESLCVATMRASSATDAIQRIIEMFAPPDREPVLRHLANDLEERFCGVCMRCGAPGHIRHFPGPVPVTNSWCDRCYRITALTWPFTSLVGWQYLLKFGFIAFWVVRLIMYLISGPSSTKP